MRVNWLAVIVSAVVYFLLGGLWYAKLFTNLWMSVVGVSQEQMMRYGTRMPYVVAFLLDLLMAWFLALLIERLSARSASMGMAVATMAWLGFVAPATLMHTFFEGQSRTLFLLDYGYVLVGMMICGAILGAWPRKA